MKSIRLLSLGLLAMSLTACAGTRMAQTPAQPELSQPPQRLVQAGYSFMPPAESGWHIAGRNGRQIVLGRFGPGRDETEMIVAGDVAAPRFESSAGFERYVRDQMNKEAEADGRFSNQRLAFTPVNHEGAQCVQAHMTGVDHQAKRRSGSKGDMMLEIVQLSCRHPNDAGTVTYLGYSQRRLPGNPDPRFMRKGMRILDSLEFSRF
jgi:hypothetical protein